MKGKAKCQCPECGSKLTAWAEANVTITYSLDESGKPTSQSIVNDGQTDGRGGFKCSSCDWELHSFDMDNHKHLVKTLDKIILKTERAKLEIKNK